mgnify:CR=1 FL=1
MAEKYICPSYPFLAFYVGHQRYQFYGGVFDLNEYPEDQHDPLRKVLSKTDPASGVMIEQEYSLPFKCEWGCERKFASQSGKNGHKSSHKTQADIDALSWREGGAPSRDS